MTEPQKTTAFLAVLDPDSRRYILSDIAEHYRITTEDAYAEVTDPFAENLLEYLGGSVRRVTNVLMRHHGFA